MMHAVKQIRDLPDDVINVIFEFIPYNNLICVNSYYYNLYHYLIKNDIQLFESYIRDMIRRDNNFVFKQLIRENIENWIRNRQYRYKNMVFSNYIYFVLHFCIENKSERCRTILVEEFAKRDLCRNLHKKNVIKYIKWIS
jgi:hypothetical protein